jgi:hypothetical protein
MQLKQIDEVSLERFINYMRIKLEQNVGKPVHWSDLELGTLLAKLDEEVSELKGHMTAKDKPVEILSECADVANFAMFVAMKYALVENGVEDDSCAATIKEV